MAGNTLTSDIEIENPDTKPLPFGFGTHPYFRVPLGHGDAEDVPGTRAGRHELGPGNLLPTGETEARRPASNDFRPAAWRSAR